MMKSNPALAQMKDIHTPETIGVWPLAPGYWLLLLSIIVVIVSAIWLFKYYRNSRAIKKAALAELHQLNTDEPELAIAINAILKRAAMSYRNRESIASLAGQHWYDWLDRSMPSADKGKISVLLTKRYQASGLSDVDKKQLLQLAEIWIKHALPLKKEAKC